MPNPRMNMFQPPYPTCLTSVKAEKIHSSHFTDGKSKERLPEAKMQTRFGKLIDFPVEPEPFTFLRTCNHFLLKKTSHP